MGKDKKVKTKNPNQTTVNLNPDAQDIKDNYVPGVGLKYMLSVGLLLFDALPAKEQRKRIRDAMERESFENRITSFSNWVNGLKNDDKRNEAIRSILNLADEGQIREYLQGTAEQVGAVPSKRPRAQRASRSTSAG